MFTSDYHIPNNTPFTESVLFNSSERKIRKVYDQGIKFSKSIHSLCRYRPYRRLEIQLDSLGARGLCLIAYLQGG